VPASIIRQRFAEDLKSEVVEALVPRHFRRETEKLGCCRYRSRAFRTFIFMKVSRFASKQLRSHA